MSLGSPLLALTLIWAAIYAVHHVLKPSRAHSLLPSSTNTRYSRCNVWNESTTQVHLSGLHLRIQTTAWNLPHDLVATSLKRGSRVRLGKALAQFYDLGSVMALIGMLGALGFLVASVGMTALSLTRKVWNMSAAPASTDPTGDLVKRTVDGLHLRESVPDGSWIKPVIPGLTVPLAHLPVILLAVFLAQVVHEFGHAMTAAIEALPVLSAGISFTVAVPSAFVNFSSAELAGLAPRARARIVAAGPFHNIILWCILLSIGYTGLGSVLWSLGYQDVSALGRVVIEIDSQSPLHGYLPSGSVITALDDTPLGSQNSSDDTWSSYLFRDDTVPPLGWCAGPFDERSCCPNNKTSGLSCFASTDNPLDKGCLDPIPILTSSSPTERCTSTTDCSATSICVTPYKHEHLLRLTIHRLSKADEAKVILWSGPRQEIWEEVRVGTLLPRIPILPLSLPSFCEIFWEYLIMGTLSLYFFNLLPMPYLDGSQFLKIMLQIALDETGHETRDEYELEAFEIPQKRRQSRRRTWWKGMLGRLIPRATIVLFASSVLLGVINVYW
ncbi:putative peptidase family M50 [Lyophyllum shimeji]|uniref:Endopeptidase S2P n=1 Tax=Lyophyllum shimeji TaxID=47721 RepID=A0A9P3UR99_LYOSH|nr:putative peptidase family M50 [Lyophyllum shimeji]